MSTLCTLILSSVPHCVLIHVTQTWSARTLTKQGYMRLWAVLYGLFPVAVCYSSALPLAQPLSTPLRAFPRTDNAHHLDLSASAHMTALQCPD